MGSRSPDGGGWGEIEVVEDDNGGGGGGVLPVIPTSRSNGVEEEEEEVYVAVGEGSSSMDALTWALKHVARPSGIVYLVHVFPAVHHVPTPWDEAETAHLRNLPGASDRLRLFQIDLLDPDSILAAIRGCAGVFQLASPCTVNSVQNPQRELLDPAVKGTLNVLCTAKESGVCRVVVTSSISAIIPSPGWPADRVKDESCWTNLDYCRQKENSRRNIKRICRT